MPWSTSRGEPQQIEGTHDVLNSINVLIYRLFTTSDKGVKSDEQR